MSAHPSVSRRIHPVTSFMLSIIVHVVMGGWIFYLFFDEGVEKVQSQESVVDLGYQTFEEPPQIQPQIKQRARTPEPVIEPQQKISNEPLQNELHDDKGVVAGQQAESKIDPQAAEGVSRPTAVSDVPFYKIKPKYPRAALVAGTEGWVLLQVDINESGEVENVRVVDGEQRNLFQSEARRAVEQWRYRPFVNGLGKPFKKIDHQVRIDFKLEDAT